MPEMPSAPLPMWIQVRLKTIKSQRELRRLLRTPYLAAQTHRAWIAWAAPILTAPRPAKKKSNVIELRRGTAA
jgi:hypothetical protein